MMRKFKHKTLGWIALEYFKTGKFYISKVNNDGTEVEIAHNVLPELIGSDREEVIEKDWIDDAYSYYMSLDKKNNVWETGFREAIEQHCPKQVKFTREEINRWYNNYPSMDGTKMVRDFLKQHNLLDEEPQGETCEHESDGGVYLTLRKEGEEVKPPKSKCKKCGVFYRN